MGCSGSTSAATPPARTDNSFQSKYAMMSSVDQGSFMQVKLARKHGADGAALAARILDLKATTAQESKALLMQAQHEEEMWRLAGQHPNLLELLEAHYDTLDSKRVCFVTELCAGALCDERHASMVQDEQQFAKIAVGMFRGVSFLHDVEVLHRNLKPANFLLSNEVKVCDFSMAVLMPRSGKVRGFAGTAPFMAPEMVKEQSYGFGVDAWSLGVTCYSLLLEGLPYEPAQGVLASAEAFRSAIKQGAPPSFQSKRGKPLSMEALKCLRSLLIREPEDRTSVTNALTCNFLSVEGAVQGSDAEALGDDFMAELEGFDELAMDRLPSLKFADRDDWTISHAKTWTHDSLPSLGKSAGSQLPTLDSLPSLTDFDSEDEAPTKCVA